jgi:hypothetical protein
MENLMSVKCLTLTVLLIVLTTFSACGQSLSQSNLKNNWGASYHAAKNSQILNPGASENLEPVEGLDGQAALINTKEYREGFAQKPKKKTSKRTMMGTNINIDLSK